MSILQGMRARVEPRLAAAQQRMAEQPLQPQWLLVVALALFAALGLWWLLGDYHAGFLWLNDLFAGPDAFWQWMTRLGDERLVMALCLLVAVRRPEAFFGVLYSRGLKPLVDAVRPPGTLALDTFHLIGPGYSHNSFPSGHTLTAFTAAGVLAAFTRAKGLRVLWLALAAVVGLSRVAVGVHWPMDVLGGAGGGILSAWLGVRLSQYWQAGLKTKVHLGLLLLPLGYALSLWFSDGGYPASRWLAWPVAAAVWGYAWYAFRPLPAEVGR
jgi:membrane-associated phospholipid phosphatase